MGRDDVTPRGLLLVLFYLGSSHGSISATLTCLIQAVASLHLEGDRDSYQTPRRGCPCLRLSHTHSPPPLPTPSKGLSQPQGHSQRGQGSGPASVFLGRPF